MSTDTSRRRASSAFLPHASCDSSATVTTSHLADDLRVIPEQDQVKVWIFRAVQAFHLCWLLWYYPLVLAALVVMRALYGEAKPSFPAARLNPPGAAPTARARSAPCPPPSRDPAFVIDADAVSQTEAHAIIGLLHKHAARGHPPHRKPGGRRTERSRSMRLSRSSSPGGGSVPRRRFLSSYNMAAHEPLYSPYALGRNHQHRVDALQRESAASKSEGDTAGDASSASDGAWADSDDDAAACAVQRRSLRAEGGATPSRMKAATVHASQEHTPYPGDVHPVDPAERDSYDESAFGSGVGAHARSGERGSPSGVGSCWDSSAGGDVNAATVVASATAIVSELAAAPTPHGAAQETTPALGSQHLRQVGSVALHDDDLGPAAQGDGARPAAGDLLPQENITAPTESVPSQPGQQLEPTRMSRWGEEATFKTVSGVLGEVLCSASTRKEPLVAGALEQKWEAPQSASPRAASGGLVEPKGACESATRAGTSSLVESMEQALRELERLACQVEDRAASWDRLLSPRQQPPPSARRAEEPDKNCGRDVHEALESAPLHGSSVDNDNGTEKNLKPEK